MHHTNSVIRSIKHTVPRSAVGIWTWVLAAHLLLSVLLLLVPYWQYLAFGAETYTATRHAGLDPRDWFPFSRQGAGNLLYELSEVIWLSTLVCLIPLAIVQAYHLHHYWQHFSKWEKLN